MNSSARVVTEASLDGGKKLLQADHGDDRAYGCVIVEPAIAALTRAPLTRCGAKIDARLVETYNAGRRREGVVVRGKFDSPAGKE